MGSLFSTLAAIVVGLITWPLTVAGAPIIGLVNFILAMGVGALLLGQVGKDLSLRIGMAFVISIWVIHALYVFLNKKTRFSVVSI